MRRLAWYTAFLSLVVALVCVAVVAQGPTGSIHGVVRDVNGVPVANATVTLTRNNAVARSTATDTHGEFTFLDIAVGTYALRARHEGYEGLLTTTVVENQTSELSVSLPGTRADQERREVKASSPFEATAAATANLAATTPVPPSAAPGIGRHTFLAGAPNTESYARIDDNRWLRTLDRPLSTCSVDVDTASYANVRRFLNGGQLPPADAVRIEEMINYFDYDYPAPQAGEPFTVTTALDAAAWNPRHRLAMIGLQARRLERSDAPPKNLVFLIDVSGSMMAPHKLPLVQGALAMLARNLGPRDRIAIAVYAGAAGVVLPPTAGDDTSTILEAIGRLEAGGSTNGAAGIRLAYSLARRSFIRGGSNRVVLATDGDFNVGISSDAELTSLIEAQRASGVTLSVLGFGMGNLKDAKMELLADRGNGNYSYIDSLSEARKVLVEEADGTLVTVAKDVKLQVEFNPAVVAAYRLIGYENRVMADRDFNDDTRDAGDMGAGHSVTALYELILTGDDDTEATGVDPLKYQAPRRSAVNPHRDEAFTVKIRYKQPDGERSSLMSVAVAADAGTAPALTFASAVAEFGMLLRDSEFKAQASYAGALKRAAAGSSGDRHGHRAELLRLIEAAQTLSALKHATD